MKIFKFSIFTLFAVLPSVAIGFECIISQCYINAYSSVDRSQLPIVLRVENIYTKLTRVIGSQKALRSKLLVIDSDGYPWALALSDNTVVLTKGAIKRMYLENDLPLGDARAAFVLGHELSHLGTEDLFHSRAFLSNQNPDIATTLFPKPGRLEEELRADLRGYTFATIAGFHTDRLLNGEDDFFRYWLGQLGRNSSSTHPDNETRRLYLKRGFESVLNDVPYYHFAVALAYFGHYQDAQLLLENSLNRVETQQAYANLGYVHIQRAREKMPADIAYKYWIPTILEPKSGFDLKRERGLFDQAIPEQAMRHLVKAEQRLKHAINIDDEQLTNHINLAAVYLYMPDKLHRAYSSVQDAMRTPLGRDPRVREQLESIYQLIRVNDDVDGADRWSAARDVLAKLVSQDTVSDNLLFNFARMLDGRGRDNTASEYWDRLYRRLDALPPAYQAQVCFRLRKSKCGSEQQEKSPWNTQNVPIGQDIRYPVVSQYLRENWNAGSLPVKSLPNLKAQVYVNQQGDSLIALDDYIEMMILRNVPPEYETLAELQEKFGAPTVSIPLTRGELLSFNSGWAVIVQDLKIVEIWIAEL